MRVAAQARTPSQRADALPLRRRPPRRQARSIRDRNRQRRDWQEGLTLAASAPAGGRPVDLVSCGCRTPASGGNESPRAARGPDGTGDGDDLREALRETRPAGIDPEEFWALGQELGYDVEVRWSAAGGDGCYDVDFRRRPARPCRRVPERETSRPGGGRARPWASYANDPLRGKVSRATRAAAPRASEGSCRSTWCRRRSWCWTPCR